MCVVLLLRSIQPHSSPVLPQEVEPTACPSFAQHGPYAMTVLRRMAVFFYSSSCDRLYVVASLRH